TTCPANANLVFSASGANSITVPWSCDPPQLSVDRSSFDANSNCTFDTQYFTWSCKVTLSSNKDAQQKLNWSATSSGITDQGFNVNFSPPSDTLTPGGSESVSISIASTSHASCTDSG